MAGILVAILLLGADLSSMRCGNLLVVPGANKLDVLSRCGEPHLRERVSGADARSEEVWIYDQPEHNAQKLLRFEGVTLTMIRETGHASGHPGDGAMRCDGRLMRPGTTKLTVKKRCGEPDLVERISGEEQMSRETWIYDQGDVSVELRFVGVQLDHVEWRDH